MLIPCPECSHEISDKAIQCPNCGYPMISPKQSHATPKPRNMKRQRLPNGFGRITEIKNKRLRKPFRAMVSDGKDEHGRPIGRLLKPEAYFATYNEAYQALMKYKENPYDFANDLTVEELYDRWTESLFKKVGASRKRQIKCSWHYCDTIKDKRVQELRIRDVKNVLDNGFKYKKNEKIYLTPSMKDCTRVMLSQMLDYAVEYEIIQHNFMKDVKISTGEGIERNSHIAFTKEEINIIKTCAKVDEYMKMILINIYMGWRPNELLTIKITDVHMKEEYIVGGSKTKAGKGRKVPIHHGIMPYIGSKYNEALLQGRTYLFEKIEYETYRKYFIRLMKEYNLNPNHRPHDCRKTFVTLAKNKGVAEYAIKRIVGHAITDITESIYTERDVAWLKKEIEKIPF